MGIEFKPPKFLQILFGHHVEINVWGVIFLVLVFLETLTLIGCCVANIVINSLAERDMTSYFMNGLVILTVLAMLYLSIDAVVNENQFQLFAFAIMSLFLIVRIVYGYIAYAEYLLIPYIISGVAILVANIGFILLLFPLVRSFGWKMFNLVGANARFVRMYTVYSIFVSLVKFDLLFCFQVSLMGFFFVPFDWWISYIGLGTGIFFTFVSAPLVVFLGVRWESYIISIIYWIWSLGLPIYLTYKTVTVWVITYRPALNLETKIYLTIVASAATLNRIILMAVLIIVMAQYKRGLTKVFGRDLKDPETSRLSAFPN